MNKLSQKTIEELVLLVNHFDLGAEVKVNVDDKNISITGYDYLNEQGNIGVARNYDFDYGVDNDGKWEDSSSEMFETISEDDKVLKKASLYDAFENTKSEMEE